MHDRRLDKWQLGAILSIGLTGAPARHLYLSGYPCRVARCFKLHNRARRALPVLTYVQVCCELRTRQRVTYASYAVPLSSKYYSGCSSAAPGSAPLHQRRGSLSLVHRYLCYLQVYLQVSEIHIIPHRSICDIVAYQSCLHFETCRFFCTRPYGSGQPHGLHDRDPRFRLDLHQACRVPILSTVAQYVLQMARTKAMSVLWPLPFYSAVRWPLALGQHSLLLTCHVYQRARILQHSFVCYDGAQTLESFEQAIILFAKWATRIGVEAILAVCLLAPFQLVLLVFFMSRAASGAVDTPERASSNNDQGSATASS